MNFKVGDKEYTLEYTFEAAENQKCVDAMTDIFGGAMMTKIYAGLLENHGEDGDGGVMSRLDAKRLYKKFCKENPDDVMASSYYGLITVISEQMEKDGFFKRTGLADILESMGRAIQETGKPVKKPTDRKKKQPVKKQKEAAEKKVENHSTSE